MSMSTPPPVPAPADLLALVAELDATERGFVLGRLATLGLDPGAPAAPLAEPSGPRCAQALTRIAQLERPVRLSLMKLLAREVVSATPAGSAHIHPDTLGRALAAESTDTLRVILGAPAGSVPRTIREAARAVVAARADGRTAAEGGVPAIVPSELPSDWNGVPSETIAELLRSVLAAIVPVAGGRVEAGNASPLAVRLAEATAAELLSHLADAGAALLGTSLQGADAAMVERAVEELGAPWADRVRKAMAGGAPGPSWPALSRERARLLVAATGRAPSPLGTLHRLGAVALGALLASEARELVDTVAQRLPSDLGQRLRAAAGD
jgi:hypothetical protein